MTRSKHPKHSTIKLDQSYPRLVIKHEHQQLTHLIWCSCTGEEVTIVMTMQRHIKHMRIFIENLLCGVAMVNIPVDDEYFVEFQLKSKLLGCDCHRVEEAETHCLRALRMMTRRAYYS